METIAPSTGGGGTAGTASERLSRFLSAFRAENVMGWWVVADELCFVSGIIKRRVIYVG